MKLHSPHGPVSARPRRPRGRGQTLLAAALAIAAGAGAPACGGGGGGGGGDAITVGLLLPFTGADSATSSNFERAVLFAAGRVNAAGGLGGRRLRIVSQDTHSDLDRALSSTQALIAAGAVAVIGPESADIAAVIAPILAQNQVTFLSPLVGAGNDATVNCAQPWFRLAPSSHALGEGIAKLISAEGLASTSILYEVGAYNEALQAATRDRFVSLRGRVTLTIALDPLAQSYAAEVRSALASNGASLVLATSPRTGALVVNEVGALRPGGLRWFLSPLLQTALLLENVAPSALEGALGVAPKIYDTTAAFPEAFARRWQGDQPLQGAYFYYDAMALLTFALHKTAPAAGSGAVDPVALQAAIVDAAAPPGEAIGWDEIESGLARQAGGSDVYYSGLTGPLLLDACGARLIGVTSTWEVQAGKILTR